MKFLADCMLGKLAKWLRLLGQDTAYYRHAEDSELVRVALREERLLLTRDWPLVNDRMLTGRTFFIHSESTPCQLRQVIRAFGLPVDERRMFTRCIVCNSPIQEVSRNWVKHKVPPYVYQTQVEFGYCALCDRVYWRGTHVDHVVSALETSDTEAGGMDAVNAIRQRRSIRAYRQDPVPDEVLHDVLAAGFCAPSAHGTHPWHVIVVREKKKLRRLSEVHRWSKFIAEAPLVIVVCVDRDVAKDFWVEDGSAFIHSAIIAAQARGLGTCWVAVRGAIFEGIDSEEMVRDILGVPARMGIIALTPLGYPAEEKPGHELELPKGRVHKERFGG